MIGFFLSLYSMEESILVAIVKLLKVSCKRRVAPPRTVFAIPSDAPRFGYRQLKYPAYPVQIVIPALGLRSAAAGSYICESRCES